jgi:stage IV sporulation protein FB
MFFEPVETPYDIYFRLFGVDVRINPWFWLMSALLGWSTMRSGLPFLLMWIVCVLVSILIHEFGHVVMGRLFGTDGYIVLYSFGGLAVGSNQVPSWWKRILVSFAGPLAGFLFLGLILVVAYCVTHFFGEVVLNPIAESAFWYLVFINLGWGILNLLPIWPLDGGQISFNFFSRFYPDRGPQIAHGISFLVAGILAVNALAGYRGHGFIPFAPGGLYAMLLFGSLAFGSYSAMQRDNNPW